jgi:hypothetical protein
MTTCVGHLTTIRPSLQNLEKGTCGALQVSYSKRAKIKLLFIIHNTNHNGTNNKTTNKNTHKQKYKAAYHLLKMFLAQAVRTPTNNK